MRDTDTERASRLRADRAAPGGGARGMSDLAHILTTVDEWLSGGGSVLLMTDYDGTLTPIVDDPADAVLSDIGRRHEGHAELRTLFEDEVIAVKAIFTPDAVRHEDGQVVVEGPAHGDFKGSPIRFTYRFTLENDAIKALEIML